VRKSVVFIASFGGWKTDRGSVRIQRLRLLMQARVWIHAIVDILLLALLILMVLPVVVKAMSSLCHPDWVFL